MKKPLVVLALFVSLICHAEPYFPGAWYSTKAPSPSSRQAGGLQTTFVTGGTVDFQIYLGGAYLESVSAITVKGPKFWTFTLVDSDGWVWKGKLNLATTQLTGTFISPTGAFRGKWQASFEDDGVTSATGQLKGNSAQPSGQKSYERTRK